jgi:hypothetical protein
MKRDEQVSARRSSAWRIGGWAASALALLASLGASCSAHKEDASGTTTGGTAGATTTTSSTATGVTGTTGGTLDTLGFAIVGDTRPPNEDDTSVYPTAVITKIWQEVQATSPRPPFAVSTGDYMFANITGTQQEPQMALYLGARAAYSGVTFAAMGNHECTGADASNCGTGNKNAITPNYTTFLTKMLNPIGITLPYYTVNVSSAKAGAWTAKLVFIAANAWDATQSAWLDAEMAKPTTYTFVVRHEGKSSDDPQNPIPGIAPSEAIIAKYPWTVKLVGHTHTYEFRDADREIVVGNGGAPLSGSPNYGYVIATQRADGNMVFNSIDYSDGTSIQTIVITPTGTVTN